jgi:hypothetical protein
MQARRMGARPSVVIGVAIALVGLSAICLGIGIWRNLPSAAGRVGAALLIGWGILSIPASVFPLDPPGAAPTLSGTIHNIAGLSFLLAIPAVLLIEFAEDLLYRAGFIGQPSECIQAAGVSANSLRTVAGERNPSRSISHCWL